MGLLLTLSLLAPYLLLALSLLALFHFWYYDKEKEALQERFSILLMLCCLEFVV